MSQSWSRRAPAGAEPAAGGVHFRVWAPDRLTVDVVFGGTAADFVPLEREPANGYFSGLVAGAGAGTLYKYRLDGTDQYPDPASRFQPEGPHGFSQVIDPDAFAWTDGGWKGVNLPRQVIYEMHIGTFTPEGTWKAAIAHLPYLADTGITLLEVMPVSDFPGRFGWGYDGVHPFAPTRLYGCPDDFREFVDRAHAAGLGVILDVVYNHLGPDGNYFDAYSKDYSTKLHKTDWGAALNFYGKRSGPVRDFFASNAAHWIRQYHLDGLRLDATQNIYDTSKDHILARIGREARQAAGHRSIVIVAENEPQETKHVMPVEKGGYGLDGLWNDDFHHSAMVRLSGHSEAYYSDYRGTPQEFLAVVKYGYLYQGQYYSWQRKRRGTPSFDCRRPAFVTFLQNHDQVANSARGWRVDKLASPAMLRTMTALCLLGPGTPMLFQGEEFMASSPFLFFADQNEEIAEKVRAGRREFLSQFPSMAGAEMSQVLADPCSADSFERSKLDHGEREHEPHRQFNTFVRDLLRLRREDAVLSAQGMYGLDGAVLSPEILLIRAFGELRGDDRLLIVNLGTDVLYSPSPEPLLAPPEDRQWEVIFSTEASEYAGSGAKAGESVDGWRIPGRAAVVFKPVPRVKLDPKVVQLLNDIEAAGGPPLESMSPTDARRAAIDGLAEVRGEPEWLPSVENRTIPGPGGSIPIRIYSPDASVPRPCLVYFHGGGWVVCDLDTHDSICRSLARRAGAVVVAVDYRLAPEHRFPAAVEDCYAATEWVAAHASELAVDRDRICVGGDSAGGNLATVVSLKARKEGGPGIALQVLVYPVTNLAAFDTPSYREFASGYYLTKTEMEWFRGHYLASEEDGRHPHASPLLAADLRGLPPALVITAECDVLRDEGEAYAQRLLEAGVPTVCTRYPGMIHPFFSMQGLLPQSLEAITQAAEAVRRAGGPTL